MVEKISAPQKPHGLSRLAFRLPLWLYQIGLGRFLGKRVLRLTHTGRKSGLPRQSVLEVVRYDQTTGACIVASGWGEKSDWYRNVLAHPQVHVQIGSRSFTAQARRLSPDEAGRELVNYANLHPMAFRELVRFMGYRLDGSEKDIFALGQQIPMFIFTPEKDSQQP